jgi:DNA excision repair protein ERCC-2
MTADLSNRPGSEAPGLASLPVAVRVLAEATHRQGGLGGPAYASVSGPEGTRLHQKLVQRFRRLYGTAAVDSEMRLQGETIFDQIALQVSGRCDLVIRLPEGPVLIEAKSFAGSPRLLPDTGDPLHWAQAYLYGHLYLQGYPASQLTVGLTYISLETDEIIEHRQVKSRNELADFFTSTTRSFADLAGRLISSQRIRDESARTCEFPFPALRPGQKRLMNEVIGTARQKGVLFAQAPTGTGKTLSVLFPSIRLLSRHLIDRVFYVTAMTSTRKIAEQALADLRANGLVLRSLTLQAKEKSCLKPEIYCDLRKCPFATAYYKNLPRALEDLSHLGGHCRPADIRTVALARQVCPFELSLDYALYCDVIIGDYNYVFDPRVQLERFFAPSDQTNFLLVDEAHNLPDRSREMFSASLDFTKVSEALDVIKDQHPLLERMISQLASYGDLLLPQLRPQAPGVEATGFAVVEHDQPGRLMNSENFCAQTGKPLQLLKILGRVIHFARQFLDDHPDFPELKKVLELFLTAFFFTRVAEEFYGSAYITTATSEKNVLQIRFMCLDASTFLTDVYRDRHPVVFFSATMTPLNYYIGLLDSDCAGQMPEQLILASPFPRDHLLVLIESRWSTRYADRTSTVQPILEQILAAVRCRIGNYLVFLPSYGYLNQVRQLLRARSDRADLDFIVQVPSMDEQQKQKYLQRFEQYGQKTLVGLAVMGSLFNEGIDLAGERLSGVIIVGVGLPQISPEREIMSQYFASRLGRGFEYAYQFPGFNKVQQAAGRVIRSESDVGFVLLIDDRYEKPEYQALFPEEWQPVRLSDQTPLDQCLSEFWSDHKS